MEELKNWLNAKLLINEVINDSLMNNLIGREMSNRLYKLIPSENNSDSHLEKVKYMMDLLKTIEDTKENTKEKSKLNLVIADGSSSLEYVEYFSKDFEVNVVDFKSIKNITDVDLILFTGGEDVDPELYNESKGKFTYINKNRDQKEKEVFNFFKGYVPMLGICRGNQLLCVLNGGKLIQHVEGHGKEHKIRIKDYQIPVIITSTHHQMVYPFNLKEENYELIAYSEFFKSNTYLNGNNEEIDLPKEFLEPEIVFYPKTKCLGIQGHPEYESCPSNTKNICMSLIKKYLLNKNLKENETSNYDWYDSEYLKNSVSLSETYHKYSEDYDLINKEYPKDLKINTHSPRTISQKMKSVDNSNRWINDEASKIANMYYSTIDASKIHNNSTEKK